MWLVKPKILQIDSMDTDLRREIWNILYPNFSSWINSTFWATEKAVDLARLISNKYLKQTDRAFEKENNNSIDWRLHVFVEKLENFMFLLSKDFLI